MSDTESKKIFQKKFNELLSQYKITQKEIAKLCDVSTSTVSTWSKGQNMPRMDKIEKLADHFGLTKSHFIEDADTLPANAMPFHETYMAPILGYIPAGYPALAVEDIEGYASIPYPDTENYFFLRVSGDSMINAGIQSGDLVLIRRQPCADNGQIVAARVNGDEATLKRYTRQGGTVLLLAENPAYDPKIVPVRDFEDGNAQIIGVAIEVRHML